MSFSRTVVSLSERNGFIFLQAIQEFGRSEISGRDRVGYIQREVWFFYRATLHEVIRVTKVTIMKRVWMICQILIMKVWKKRTASSLSSCSRILGLRWCFDSFPISFYNFMSRTRVTLYFIRELEFSSRCLLLYFISNFKHQLLMIKTYAIEKYENRVDFCEGIKAADLLWVKSMKLKRLPSCSYVT